MQRFSFKLESVRQLRAHSEQLAKEALAGELAAGERCDEALREAEQAVVSARGGTWDGASTGVDLAAREAYLLRREREQLAAQLLARSQEAQIEEQRTVLQQAAVELAALDRLKERRQVAHVARALGAEREELADITLARHTSGDAA
jgi:flagellar export protein FliJ